MDHIVFGMGPQSVGPDGPGARRRFADLLSEALGRSVEMVVAPSYQRLLRMIALGSVHVAWLPPAVFVRTEERARMRALLVSERARAGRYHGAMFMRADDPQQFPDELDEPVVAWVDGSSCAGYLFPRFALAEKGIHPDHFFGDQLVLQSHAAVVHAVAVGRADLGATYAHYEEGDAAMAEPVRAGWLDVRTGIPMRQVLRTRAIPSDLICAERHVEEEMGADIVAAMRGLTQIDGGHQVLLDLFQVRGFAPYDPKQYEVVRAALNVAHLPRLGL